MESRGEHLQNVAISVLFAVRDAVGAAGYAQRKECLSPAEREEPYAPSTNMMPASVGM